MDTDDSPRGRLLTRREMLTLLGAGGAALATGGALVGPRGAGPGRSFPGCIVRPEQTAGPYFVDERLHRSDIRSDPGDGSVSPGVPLALSFLVSRVAPRAAQFTSQLYFDDALTDRVHQEAPYATKGDGRVRNEGDRIFRRGGRQLLLDPTVVKGGYQASFEIGLDLG